MLLGVHNETCISCRLFSFLIGSDELVHICPWGCIILAILIAAIVLTILWILKKKKETKEDVEEAVEDAVEDIMDAVDDMMEGGSDDDEE